MGTTRMCRPCGFPEWLHSLVETGTEAMLELACMMKKPEEADPEKISRFLRELEIGLPVDNQGEFNRKSDSEREFFKEILRRFGVNDRVFLGSLYPTLQEEYQNLLAVEKKSMTPISPARIFFLWLSARRQYPKPGENPKDPSSSLDVNRSGARAPERLFLCPG